MRGAFTICPGELKGNGVLQKSCSTMGWNPMVKSGVNGFSLWFGALEFLPLTCPRKLAIFPFKKDAISKGKYYSNHYFCRRHVKFWGSMIHQHLHIMSDRQIFACFLRLCPVMDKVVVAAATWHQQKLTWSNASNPSWWGDNTTQFYGDCDKPL